MPEPFSQRVRHFLIATLAVVLLFGGIWFAVQGGLLPPKSYLSKVAGKFSAVIAISLASAPYLASLWLGAAGWGYLVRRWLARDTRNGIVVQLGAGLGLMLMIDWLLAWAGLMDRWTSWGVCAVGFFILTWRLPGKVREMLTQPERWPSPPWTLVLGLPAVGLLLTACACPPSTLWSVEAGGYDVLSYHLEVPREWLDAGRMTGLHHNAYSYLPMLTEAGYMQAGAMVGSVQSAIYITQLWHATTALLAAAAVAGIVRRRVGTPAGIIGGIFLHAAPWVIITGSLSYNECFVLALGGTALLLTFDPASDSRRGAVLVGLLVGWATLAKLPAGPMVALPIAFIMLLRLHRTPGMDHALTWPRAAKLTAMMVFGAALAVAPWLIRNAAWTGNPVFPMATNVLGRGHWDEVQSKRWNNAHGSAGVADGVSALGRQWLFNEGYGTLWGGRPTQERFEAAVFATELGVPIIWITTILAVVLALRWSAGRRIALAMLLMIGVQLVFWIVATHHQSRFLIPTLLPACVLIGIGGGRLDHLMRLRARAWTIRAIAGAAVLMVTVSAFQTFYTQTPKVRDPVSLEAFFLPPYNPNIIDGLNAPLTEKELDRRDVYSIPGDHILNHVNNLQRVLIVADASALLYIKGPTPQRFVYHTAFDASQLGEIIRANDRDPARVTHALRQQGFTHVWIGWSELFRLHGSYGYDEDVSIAYLQSQLAPLWWPLRSYGDRQNPSATLYRLTAPPEVP